MAKYISALVITFYIYGFCGWLWESFICPIITRHKIKNSGFLNGPIVPIYGVGAIVVALLFSSHDFYFSVFIEGAFVACVIEYVTSWAMETLYHRRWWDYSDKAFNVNGRVCLEGFLVFGLFSVVAVKFIQPQLMGMVMQFDKSVLCVMAIVFTIALMIDLWFTVTSLAHLEERIDMFIKDVEEYAQRALNGFENSKRNVLDILETMKIKDSRSYQEFLKQKRYVEKRILKAFPELMNKRKDK